MQPVAGIGNHLQLHLREHLFNNRSMLILNIG